MKRFLKSDVEKTNILLVHQSADLYGSDRTLLMLVQGLLESGRWWPIVAIPRAGPLLEALKNLGAEVHIAEVAHVSRSTASLRGIARLLVAGLRCGKELEQIVGNRPLSIVHSNTIAVLGGALWAARRRHTHVWHVHEIITSPAAARWGFPRLVHALADHVIANSCQTLAWLTKQQPHLASVSDVVFNGVSSPMHPLPEETRSVRRRLKCREDDVLVTLAGRINHWKGHKVLLDSVAQLRSNGRGERVRVAIVGSPLSDQTHLQSELQQKCRLLGLDDCVTFLPFVENIWPIWYATDIAVIPSIEPEPFGLVAIEAMAAGVCVVASNHGGLMDIVEDGKTGRLVTPGDSAALARALDELAHDSATRRELGTAGRERQERVFSVQSYVESMLQTYEKAISHVRSSRAP